MKKKIISFILIFLFAFSSNFSLAASQGSIRDGQIKMKNHPVMLKWEHIPHEIIVKFHDRQFAERIQDENKTTNELLKDYSFRNSVEFAEPNYVFGMQITPNDPSYSTHQAYIPQIHVNDAWNETAGSQSVTVAVLDTGVDLDHPDLSGNIWNNSDEITGNGIDDDKNGYIDDRNGYDFVNNNASPNPKVDNGSFNEAGMHHGTVVAGLIGAVGNNAVGITGVNWDTSIMAVRVLNSDGQGEIFNIAQGIRYATDNGADVINMSLSGFAESQGLNDAIDYAYSKGSVVIAAAGNAAIGAFGENIDIVQTYPACSDNGENQVIAVAALDSNDKKAAFSDYGTKCIDMSAPGVDLYSTQTIDPGNGLNVAYGSGWSGTSFSAPLVSGVAALLLSENPSLSNKQIGEILIASGDNVDNKSSVIFAGKMGVKVNAKRAIITAKTTEGVNNDGDDSGNGTPDNPTNEAVERDLEGKILGQLRGDVNIYLIDPESKIRHVIPHDDIFYSWGFQKEDIQILDSVSEYALGEPIKFRDGFLIKGTEAPVYLVTENGQRTWITNEATFYALGYSFDQVFWISDAEVSQYPKLSEWSISYQHPNGALFKYATDARVYLIENGFKRPFMSEDAFLSRGYYFKYVLTLPDTESYPTGEKIE